MQQPTTQTGIFQTLQGLGFSTPAFGTVAKKDLVKFYDDMKDRRDSLDYEVDGLVFSTDDCQKIADLGFIDRDCPRAQIALKYPPKIGVVIIKQIEVSADGAAHLSPVAIFDPVELGGAEIRRASLKSYRWMFDRQERVKYFRSKVRETGVTDKAEIERLSEEWAGTEEVVGEGSVVEIARSGDVIPVIKRVVSNKVAHALKPTCCPTCGGPTCENGAFIDCANDECDSKEAARMVRFLTALRVKGLAQDTLVLYANAGVKVRDFFLKDNFAAIEAKIALRTDISKKVFAKIKAQLLAD